MRLEGKTTVITGGGSGLGREGALLFAREGANVLVMERAAGRAKAVASQVVDAGGSAQFYEGDAGDEADMKAAVDLAVKQFGRLDIMWANAGHFAVGMGRTPIELGASRIRVNRINPAHGMSVNFLMPRDAEVVGKSYEAGGACDADDHASPVKHPFPPELIDNADYALFSVSDEGRWVSGQCLDTADGGTSHNVAMNFPDNWQDELTAHA